MPGKKRGSRRFNSAVSSEKNKMKLDEFINEVIKGTVNENKELAYVEKSLSNSRWSVKYYTQRQDRNNRVTTIEHTYQATKAGNLLKSAAPISVGSVVLLENVSCNETPQFIITCVFDKESIKEFKKIYEVAYERILNKLENGEDVRPFWVDNRIFNQDIIAEQQQDTGIEFGYDDSDEEENNKKEETIIQKPKKRTFKTISTVEEEEASDVDIDNI